MTVDEIRALEIQIAKALGFKVKKATLYMPGGTLLGGNFAIHAGIEVGTPEDDESTWKNYAPRFTRDMGNAEWLLEQVYTDYGLQYNMFRDNGLHTCEIGDWTNDPGERDHAWSATEATMALAVVKAIEKCEIVMGLRLPAAEDAAAGEEGG